MILSSFPLVNKLKRRQTSSLYKTKKSSSPKAASFFIDEIPCYLTKARRKTILITVRPDGCVYVRAPYWTTQHAVLQVVNKRLDWIHKHLDASPRLPDVPQDKASLAQLRQQAAARFKTLYEPWVAVFERDHHVKPAAWRVRDMTSRWGSCSLKTGRITLNVRLMFKSDACVEYVIVHELCHLLVNNHSAAFYTLVSRYLPDWKERRKSLNSKTDH